MIDGPSVYRGAAATRRVERRAPGTDQLYEIGIWADGSSPGFGGPLSSTRRPGVGCLGCLAMTLSPTRGVASMIPEIVKWLLDSGTLDTVLEQLGTTHDEHLTRSDVEEILDEYIERLVGRLDEDRWRQLGGALTLLKDASHSVARAALAAEALSSFHQIAALPVESDTGDFSNRELIFLALVGMAVAHDFIGDPREIVATKLVEAIDTDPSAAESLFGKPITNAIYRRIRPTQFWPLGGSPKKESNLFPENVWYFVPRGSGPHEVSVSPIISPHEAVAPHLWIQEQHAAGSGLASYLVGLTHYAALHLSSLGFVVSPSQLPRNGAQIKQGTKCGQITLVGGDATIYAPLTGGVAEVNERHAGALDSETLVQEPYQEGWLFRIIPKHSIIDESGRWLNANEYRDLLSQVSGVGTQVCVESIAYETEGGTDQARDLLVTITVVDHLGRPTDGVSVTGWLLIDDAHLEFAGRTGQDGSLIVVQKDAPAATFRIIVHDIEMPNGQWGASDVTPWNEFRK